MKIVLVGYMASGKSIIGKLLASKVNVDFIDLDAFIESQENMSIANIFASRGEIYFRKIESKYLHKLLESTKDYVLSVGGGTPCYGNNLNEIKRYSKSIYLKASIKTIYNRLLLENDKRPLVSEVPKDKLEEFIAKHLFERRNFYEQADYSIEVSGKTPDEITNELIKLI
jgi:shikimate kinase